MINKFLLTTALCLGAAGALSAASVCPMVGNATTDCDFVITVGTTGSVTVADVPGSTPFNQPMTLVDGTMVPGGDASLVGVVNDYSRSLTSLTIHGSGANAGIFDFSFNGICVYTNASYCGTAATGYEGPTSTFGGLMPSGFQTPTGTVTFDPALGMGQSTYFSLQDSASDITGHGGLTILGETFSGSTATPEPADFALMGTGISLLLLWSRRKRSA